jgi:hypothetical protein
MSFFLFIVLCCTSYAHQNKYIFVGQNENDGVAKTVFLLELTEDNLGDHIQINESGEVYLKVDRIVAIPRESILNFAFVKAQGVSNLAENAASPTLTLTPPAEGIDEEYVKCKNRDCGHYYYARPGHRDCPRCGTSN